MRKRPSKDDEVNIIFQGWSLNSLSNGQKIQNLIQFLLQDLITDDKNVSKPSSRKNSINKNTLESEEIVEKHIRQRPSISKNDEVSKCS